MRYYLLPLENSSRLKQEVMASTESDWFLWYPHHKWWGKVELMPSNIVPNLKRISKLEVLIRCGAKAVQEIEV